MLLSSFHALKRKKRVIREMSEKIFFKKVLTEEQKKEK